MKPFLPLLLAALVANPVSAADWPNFQGPTRIGISDETELNLNHWEAHPPKILWERTLNPGWGGAAIVGDEVFLTDRLPLESDVLHCIDLSTGETKWTYTYDSPGKLSFPGSRGVPLVTDEAVYFIGGFGEVHRVNRESHEADWVVSIQERYGSAPPKWGWAQSPVLVDGVLVIPAMSEKVGLVGLNPSTGEDQWSTHPFGDSHSTPTVMTLDGVKQIVFIATKNDEDSGVSTILSVTPENGTVLWETTDAYYNKIPIPFPTKIDEQRVFLTGGYGNGSAMIRVTHEGDDWNVEKLFDLPMGTQVHPPFVIGEHLYFLANENANHKGQDRKTGGLMCLTLDGEIVWQTGDTPFLGRGNTVRVGDKLLNQDGETGYLRVIEPSPEGYREIGLFDTFGKKAEVDERIAKQAGRTTIKIEDFQFWSPMALSNGHLVVRGQETVKCLDLSE